MREDFSRTLCLLRQERGLSQRKVAAELGISQAPVSYTHLTLPTIGG